MLSSIQKVIQMITQPSSLTWPQPLVEGSQQSFKSDLTTTLGWRQSAIPASFYAAFKSDLITSKCPTWEEWCQVPTSLVTTDSNNQLNAQHWVEQPTQDKIEAWSHHTKLEQSLSWHTQTNFNGNKEPDTIHEDLNFLKIDYTRKCLVKWSIDASWSSLKLLKYKLLKLNTKNQISIDASWSNLKLLNYKQL